MFTWRAWWVPSRRRRCPASLRGSWAWRRWRSRSSPRDLRRTTTRSRRLATRWRIRTARTWTHRWGTASERATTCGDRTTRRKWRRRSAPTGAWCWTASRQSWTWPAPSSWRGDSRASTGCCQRDRGVSPVGRTAASRAPRSLCHLQSINQSFIRFDFAQYKE